MPGDDAWKSDFIDLLRSTAQHTAEGTNSVSKIRSASVACRRERYRTLTLPSVLFVCAIALGSSHLLVRLFVLLLFVFCLGGHTDNVGKAGIQDGVSKLPACRMFFSICLLD